MIKKTIKKVIPIVLSLIFLIQSISAEAFSLDGYATEEELRQAIIGDARWVEQFPNGLLNFLGTQFEVSENNKYLEIPVIRQGGASGRVTVDFKAIDISAEYGEDYVIRVYENARRNQLEKNEEVIPLIETEGDSASVNISEEASESADPEPKQEEIPASTGAAIDINVDTNTEPDENPTEPSYTELPKSEVAFGEGPEGQVSSLRQAREAYIGQKSDRPDWKTVDEDSVEELKAEYDKFLYNMPGTETTLEFEDGEYIKYLYIVLLNDNLSESEEQIMFALSSPEGGVKRGEFYMAYVNIKDDEEPEKSMYEIVTPSVKAEDGKAIITVRRTSGLQQYSSINIGTEAGTAISGSDYEPGLSELFFTPGMIEQKVFVNVLDNLDRKEERQFTVALDRTSEKANLSAAEAVVTIPAAEVNAEMTARLQSNSMLALADSVPQNTNAELLTPYGYSLERGKWTLSGDDFEKAGNLSFPRGIQPYYISDGLYYNYTPSGTSTEAVAQGATYDFDNMGGVEKVSFRYSNIGAGRVVSGKSVYDYQGNLSLWYVRNGTLYLELNNAFGTSGKVPTGQLFSSVLMNESKWLAASRISLDTSSSKGSETKPVFTDITLNLKEYSVDVLAAQTLQRKKYAITNGTLSSGALYKEYSPGRLYVKNIYSNVGNFQSAPSAPKAYRSDFIELGYEYSENNPNGIYAQFTGFEIQNGTSWIPFKGTELALDSNFFKKAGVFNAIKNGTIKIRPTFAKRPAYVSINFFDKANGRLKNFPNSDTTSLTYDNLYGTNNKAGIYTGDMLEGLEAQTYYIAKAPVWYSGVFNYTSGKFDSAPTSIVFTEADANTKINYFLEKPHSVLTLSFKAPNLVVEAQPNIYKNGITQPIYKLDGVAYEHSSLATEMERVYLYPDPDADPPILAPVNANPLLDMEFNYVFSPSFPYQEKKAEFGTPIKAILRVYKKDGEKRASYDIPYMGGSFKFSGKPKELGWELDDYASVTIIGSSKQQTQEVTIDFIYNSRDGIIVTPLESDKGSNVWVGSVQNQVSIENVNPLEYYKMQALTSPHTLARWMDASPDLNRDGQIDSDEETLMSKMLDALGSKFWTLWDQNIYWGNYFTYRPGIFNNSKIYYSFEKIPENTSSQFDVSVSLYERYSTVLDNNGKISDPKTLTKRLPIKDAEVYIGSKQIYDKSYDADKADGRYIDSNPLYKWGDSYLGQLFFGGQIYNFAAKGGIAQDCEFITSDIMRPYDFKAFVSDGDTKKDKELDYINTDLDIVNAKTTFTYRFDNSKAGITPNGSIIRIYEDYECSRLFSQVQTEKPVNGEFSYTLNTYQEGIKPGYTMTIAGTLSDESGKILHEYPEVRVGVVFHQALTSLTALASFKTPVKPVLSMIGKLNNNYDLGLDVNIADVKEEFYTDDSAFRRKRKTVIFGFDDEYVKEFKSNSEATKNENKKGNDDVLEEETGNKERKDVSAKVTDDTAGAKDAPAKSNSGGGDLHMPYTISLALSIEVGQVYNAGTDKYNGNGYDYFSSLVIMATAKADYKKSNTFMTPVGIPVTVSLSAGGTAVAAIAFEADHKDPYNDKYKFDGKADVSLNPANYDTFAKFMLAPTITLSAGSGFDYINLEISGSADFDFQFTQPIFGDSTHSAGSGGLIISSKLKLKILFVQKSWTLYKSKHIDLFGYGLGKSDLQGEMLSALNDPYTDYLYESVGTISDSDIMSRDYLAQKSGWDIGEGLLQGVLEGNENVLETGAFPNPQTKMIRLDSTRTLLLFIDDDITRGERNRASLYYSIMEDGSASAPAAVDPDGTWDEDPDAFLVGDKVLVTWSDAGRSFTEVDTQIDILSAMNISGAWLDPQSGTFGAPFEITRTVVGGDEYADLNPKISYDPETKRLMVYYTKTDYTDRWETGILLTDPETLPHAETPESLYGDIVNGYNVIMYRFANFDAGTGSFVWNDTYLPEETLDEAQYYGQRFLELAPPVDIEETEYQIEDETITIGEGEDVKNITLTHTGTIQTVKNYDGLVDPRVVAMDLTTHDGRAVFAYILDDDCDLKTSGDQQLYIQTYSYAENKFSYPIEIANNDVRDTQPQFVYADGITWLYWLRDGEIVYTCIDEILQEGNLKEETSPDGSGRTFYIIDKSNQAMDSHIMTAVSHKNPIDEYHISSNGDSIYLMWTEDCTSYKNGLKPGDEGTDDPANHVKERQIFAACTVQSAGDNNFPWSKPVQVTFTPGQNFSDLSFSVPADDILVAAYARYTRQYDSSEGGFNDSNSMRTLAVNTFTITNDLEIGELSISGLRPNAGEAVYVTSDVKNTGLKPFEKHHIQFYAIADGISLYESEWEQGIENSGYILGGDTEKVYGSFVMPEDLDSVNELKVGFRVKNEAGDILANREMEIPVKPELQIRVLESELIGTDSAKAVIHVKNAGNKSFDDIFSISAGGRKVYTRQIGLKAEEESTFTVEFGLGGAEFGEITVGEDGCRFDKLDLIYNFGEFEAIGTLKREVSAEEFDRMERVESFSIIRNGIELKNSAGLSIGLHELNSLETKIVWKNGEEEEGLKVDWISSDPGIAAVSSKGVLIPMGIGTATVTGILQPVKEHSVSYTDGTFEFKNDSYTIPDDVKKQITLTVNVKSKSDSSSGDPSQSNPDSGSSTINLGNRAKEIFSGNENVAINIPAIPDAKVYTLAMPADSLTGLESKASLTVGTELGSLTIQAGMLAEMSDLGGKTAEITIAKGDRTKLSDDMQRVIGSRPIIQLALSIDGAQTGWNNPNAPVTVAIPYKPTTEELKNLESILVWYIDANGKAVSVPNGRYDAATGMVTFTTTHFSSYAVGYNNIDFSDVAPNSWYNKAVGFIAARGITSGTGGGKFSPDAKLTRGQFITMLMRTYSIDPDTRPTDNFADAGSSYYTGYLAASKRLGISQGVGNNLFAPEKEITREEMFTLIYNALKAIKRLPQGDSGKSLSEFTDAVQIKDWAREAITVLVETGTIGGSNGKLSPEDTATRAGMAQVLYNLIAK